MRPLGVQRFIGAALLLGALGALGACGEPGPTRRPDVIFVLVDTLRADRLSSYGYPRETSPFLDSLASEGALFEDVTCQFSWTRPSMVSIFHGRYLTAYRDALDPEFPSMAEVFRGAGYRTVGAVANRLVNSEGAFDRGFEHFDWASPSRRKGSPESPQARDLDELAEDLWPLVDSALASASEPLASGEAGERAPLFIYLHALDPHDPYEPHPEYDALLPVAGAEPVLPEEWQAAELEARGRASADERAALDLLQTERGRYDQGIRHMDAQLEEVFAGFESRGLLDHAVVVVASDHGEGLWEHVTPSTEEELAQVPPYEFFYQKHGASQYQEVLATPLIFWGVGVPAQRRVAQAVQNIDVFPTLLELTDISPGDLNADDPNAGALVEGDLHGRSLTGLMRDGTGDEPPFVFAYGVHGNTVRETATGLKLILPRGKAMIAGHGMRLFDLAGDPHERRDLAEDRPDDVERLVRAWKAWQEAYPTDDNRGAAMRRRADREHRQILESLGYTDMDIGGE